jgi:hypothetical protein
MRTTRSRLLLAAFSAAVLTLAHVSPAAANPPGNDDFDAATEIPALPFTAAIDTTGATRAADDPPGCERLGRPVEATVWFSFTPSHEVRVHLNTSGSAYDTVLAVYTGSRGALTELRCNDDFTAPHHADEGLSRFSFTALAGVTYSVMVGGDALAPEGALKLNASRTFAWRTETLDGLGGGSGRIEAPIRGETATTHFAHNSLQVFYFDAAGRNLRQGSFDGADWRFQTLDGAGGANGRIDAALGFDVAAVRYNGLHVFYSDESNGDLRYALFKGGEWRFRTMDGAGGPAGRVTGDVGAQPSVSRFGKKIHVFYVDRTHTNIRRATFDGTGWSFATLDGAGGANGRVNGDVGYNTAVKAYEGKLHVFYLFADEFCDPFCAHRAQAVREASFDGTSWRFAHAVCCLALSGSLSVARLPDQGGTFLALDWNSECCSGIYLFRWDGTSWGSFPPPSFPQPEIPEENDSLRGPLVAAYRGRAHLFYEGDTDAVGRGPRAGDWNGAIWRADLVDFRPPSAAIVYRPAPGVPRELKLFSADPFFPPVGIGLQLTTLSYK